MVGRCGSRIGDVPQEMGDRDPLLLGVLALQHGPRECRSSLACFLFCGIHALYCLILVVSSCVHIPVGKKQRDISGF